MPGRAGLYRPAGQRDPGRRADQQQEQTLYQQRGRRQRSGGAGPGKAAGARQRQRGDSRLRHAVPKIRAQRAVCERP